MNKNAVIIFIFSLTVVLQTSCSQKGTTQYNYVPPEGYVPNETVAIKVAEALWLPVYGNNIYNSLPFTAKLNGNIWIVTGTLNGNFSGGPYIEIQKRNGKIRKMYHEK